MVTDHRAMEAREEKAFRIRDRVAGLETVSSAHRLPKPESSPDAREKPAGSTWPEADT